MATVSHFYNANGASQDNLSVDYVINYEFPAKERDEAEAVFTQIVHDLSNTGLNVEVRAGDDNSILIFIKAASERNLQVYVYKARIQDWLHGIRLTSPEHDIETHFKNEPITEAERLCFLYMLIAKPKNEGGAGISVEKGKYKYVKSIFPLHDHAFNREWIKAWSAKYMLDDEDIVKIRNKFGTDVALYFAFLQNYFKFLAFPAAFGFVIWLFIGNYSWIYAIGMSLWSVVFFEYWKHKEADLAAQWGVKGVSKLQRKRVEFKPDEERKDPITGEIEQVYGPIKRLRTQLLQVPFAGICMIVLGILISFAYSVEIFIGEVYDGPGKSVLTFTPTVILVVGVPLLSGFLEKIASKLTDMENWETHDAHREALVQKVFVINFITSYMAIFITAFVYLPFGQTIIPLLDVFGMTSKLGSKGFQINAKRLSNQLFFFAVTAQVVNFATEVIVPLVKRKAMAKISSGPKMATNDHPEEVEFLKRVRAEAKLGKYDTTEDLREMIVQFGYLSLFSVVWPLVGLSYFINNWVEARSDAMKIAISSQRPIPWRAESIGPWINALGFLSWLGSLTSGALVYLYGGRRSVAGNPSAATGWILLTCVLLAEHIYLSVQLVVRYVLRNTDTPGLQRERALKFQLRKRTLDNVFGSEYNEKHGFAPGVVTGEKITRVALEDAARKESTGNLTQGDVFWLRQQGPAEVADIGRKLISMRGSK